MGTYIRLVDINDAKGKESAFLSAVQDKNSSIRFETSAENFSKIPGSPVAYWVSTAMLSVFEKSTLLGFLFDVKKGNDSGGNDTFVRYWFEIEEVKFDTINHSKKWVPYIKAGEARKWYGNLSWVIDWENDGYRVKHHPKSTIRNPQFDYCSGITWSDVGTTGGSYRYMPSGSIRDNRGPAIFGTGSKFEYILALLSTKIMRAVIDIVNPTIMLQVGNIKNVPVIYDENTGIESIVNTNTTLSRSDWDSFETSWDFKYHPLIRNERTITAAFANWEREAAHRFDTLKANEEKLNRIFIDIYGLQDELTPDVEEKDVTVRKADLGRDIRSFISYAVGCMFGRYSLDVEGLAYAGGDWDQSKYKTYIPDADNCIPITDEEYFDDDIVSRFVDFVKAVYGKDTLEKNLEFIAEALGNRGDTPLKTIRNYFINEFYKDHVKIYQKRPIYWLFESGKENGFKALIYMHRYNADTIGNMRIEYIHKLQAKYESQLSFEQHLIDTSQNQREKSAAMKQKEKLIRQIKEVKDYDVKIAHLANCRIEIDLDDGVKVNYEKVQTGKDGKMLEVFGKI